jgi:alpha-beta hydrolase superfamily lysophospholipase
VQRVSLTVKPTVEELTQTEQAIEDYLQEVRSHPDQRPGAHPYYRFHPAGEPIAGTVLIFHGFSARPHQMWRLADYLFDNGFNFYQVTLAGQTKVNPAKNWPQIDLKPEYIQPLREKVEKDPVLQVVMAQSLSSSQAGASQLAPQLAPGQQAALLQRLLQVAPELADIAKAISRPNHPEFKRYFISSHQQFLTDAQQRLAELAAMPGPIYTVGLSVGGAVALGLAASAPERIERAVAYAPLLKIFGEDRRRYVQLTGPLDISETGWDPDLRFPVGALTAADYFGSEVRSAPLVNQLKQVPVFMTLTENEDAADIAASEQFFAEIGAQAKGHRLFKYPAAAMVPHPMIDPSEVSQGMSNLFWQSLYQETLRFLTTGEIDVDNLAMFSQSPELPQVPPVS